MSEQSLSRSLSRFFVAYFPRLALSLFATLFLSAAFVPGVHAIEPRFHLDIPVQSLRQSLVELGDASGQSLVYSTALVDYKMGHQLRGDFNLHEALTELLRDSNLHFRRGESGIYTLYRQAPPTGFLSRFFTRLGATAKPTQSQSTTGDLLEEVVTVGSRSHRHHTRDLTVPVDVLSSDQLQQSQHLELGRKIQSLAPSFNLPISTQSDGTDAFRPTTLRGLAPDQLLVLVNGKRRHHSALLHTNNTVGRGTSGTDFNAIPESAIEQIEILRDGAAALYGSDAIAGVINVELKRQSHGSFLAIDGGQTEDGDGETYRLSASHNSPLLNDGFLHLSINAKERRPTNRANNNAECIYANSCIELAPYEFQTSDPRELNSPRDQYRVGDSDMQQWSGGINFGGQLKDNLRYYGNALWSRQEHTTAGFFRSANKPESNPIERFDGVPLNRGEAFRPDGFLPLINTVSDDRSISLGVTGDKDSLWRWDLSVNYGENHFDYKITDSLNASLVSLVGNSPSSADPGDLFHSLTTVDFDLSSRTHWGSLAVGLQWRRDHYRIDAGEPVSFVDYDTVNGQPLGSVDASSGIQVFPGYAPENAVSKQRHSQAMFISADWELSDNWQASGAVRFEHFSDADNNWSFKLSSAYQWTPSLKIRAGINTGFRAPSLQQRFYSDISNQFVQIDDQLKQLRVATINRDQLAALGISATPLKEETSINTNVGFSWVPSDRWHWTLDLYTIDINDRIVISNITPVGLDPVLDDYLREMGAEAYHGFYNGIDTRTQGVDLFGQYQRDLGDALLSVSLSANYNNTRVTKRHDLNYDKTITGLGLFSSHSESIVEDWQPDWRSVARMGLTWEHWQVSVEAESFGDYRVEESNGDQQHYSAKTLVNLRTEYHWPQGWQVALGANNVFGITPEKNRIGQTGQGTIVDQNFNPVVSSPGVFQYSRRTTPFGFNGAYYYLSVQRVWD